MLTIRFSRVGKKKKPQYRIIISEKSRDTSGTYLELLGHYDPHTKQATLKVDRIKHWLALGATTSNSVFNLLVKQEVIASDKKKKSISISARRSEKIHEKKREAVSTTEKPPEAVTDMEAPPAEKASADAAPSA